MARLPMITLAALLLALPLPAVAAKGCGEGPAWSDLPLLLPSRGMGRGEAVFRVVNTQADEGRLHAPGPTAGLGFEAFAVDAGCLRVKAAGGNYHWLTTRDGREGRVVVASTAAYFSNPGPAPRELLATPKNELELVPVKLPREHGQFQAGESWAFQVRYQGRPLAAAAVRFEDSVGEKLAWSTDDNGIARVAFPPWRDEQAWDGGHGQHGGRPPERGFVLAVEHQDGAAHYLTAFNHVYAPDGFWHKSVTAGLGFVLLGMGVAAPLWRQRGKTS